MIDTDTRQLRRFPNGFTSGSGKLPCDHCGHRVICPIKPREYCKEFLPTIPFNEQTGMQNVFNTVRVGRAWVSRLERNQHVALYDTTQKAIFGYARVLDVFAGPIKEMLSQFAHANHLMLDKEPADAADILYAWQLRNYGPRIITEASSITAIFLLRDHSATAEALLPRG